MKDTPKLLAMHDRPSPVLLFHFAWEFLMPADRVSTMKSWPKVMWPYVKLCQKAALHPVMSL